MPDLAEIINIPPKRRITIPEGHTALIMPNNTADDFKSLLILIRRGRRLTAEERQALYSISGEILLSIIEAENG